MYSPSHWLHHCSASNLQPSTPLGHDLEKTAEKSSSMIVLFTVWVQDHHIRTFNLSTSGISPVLVLGNELLYLSH